MRVERHKKEIYFVGWALLSGLLLLAAARADEATYGPTVGPPAPKTGSQVNNSSAEDILKKAKGTLPAEQYEAFEKAMRKLEGQPAGQGGGSNFVGPNRAGVPGEPVIDGAGIPSVITFERGGKPAPDRAPAEAPAQPTPGQPQVAPTQPAPAQPITTQPPAQPVPAIPAQQSFKPQAPAPAPAKTGSKSSKPTQFYDPSLPSPDPVR